jgi:hypothetical protein
MVEIHLVWAEGPAAIRAGSGAQRVESKRVDTLAVTDSGDLPRPVGSVVRDIRPALIPLCHDHTF